MLLAEPVVAENALLIEIDQKIRNFFKKELTKRIRFVIFLSETVIITVKEKLAIKRKYYKRKGDYDYGKVCMFCMWLCL